MNLEDTYNLDRIYRVYKNGNELQYNKLYIESIEGENNLINLDNLTQEEY